MLSSKIEGTVTSLTEVFSYEAQRRASTSEDVREVVNYVMALEIGIDELQRLPISLRLVNQVHQAVANGCERRGKASRSVESRTGVYRNTGFVYQ